MQAPLGDLLDGPLSAIRGAVDTVRYAQAFVAHPSSAPADPRTDDDERELILEEEFPSEPQVPELPVSPR